jgi:hypothetical protein
LGMLLRPCSVQACARVPSFSACAATGTWLRSRTAALWACARPT